MKGPHPEATSKLIKVPLGSGNFMFDVAKPATTGKCVMDLLKSRRVLPARKQLGGMILVLCNKTTIHTFDKWRLQHIEHRTHKHERRS